MTPATDSDRLEIIREARELRQLAVIITERANDIIRGALYWEGEEMKTNTTQDLLALAEEIIIKAISEADNEKAEDLLTGVYRAIGKARRELRRQEAKA